jgi:hypothetical protein
LKIQVENSSWKFRWKIQVENSGGKFKLKIQSQCKCNLIPQACDPREGMWGSGIIRCRKPEILAKIELRIPYQRPIRFLPETDYPRASHSFPRIAGSGNEIGVNAVWPDLVKSFTFGKISWIFKKIW